MINRIRNYEHYSSVELSNWHRERLARHHYMMDLDFKEVDSDANTVMIVEYKHFQQKHFDMNTLQLRNLAKDGDKLGCAAFLVCYSLAGSETKFTEFLVVGLNERAKFYLNFKESVHMSEARYARLISHCRKESRAVADSLSLTSNVTPGLFSAHQVYNWTP